MVDLVNFLHVKDVGSMIMEEVYFVTFIN